MASRKLITFDDVLMNFLQAEGAEKVLDAVFAVLASQTDFYVTKGLETAEQIVLKSFAKHKDIAIAEKKNRDEELRRKEAMLQKQKEEEKLRSEGAALEEVSAEKAAKIQEEIEQAKKAQCQKAEQLKKEREAAEKERMEKAKREKKEIIETNDVKGTLLPNEINGCDLEHYRWGQTLEDIEIKVPAPQGLKIRSKDVVVEIRKKSLKVGLKGFPLIIDGELFADVKMEECFWLVEENKTISISLMKVDRDSAWWPHLVLGDPEINTRKTVPEPSRVSDLEGDHRASVEKMLYDQRQKMMGLPTSDEQKAQEALRNIMAKNPNIRLAGSRPLIKNC